VHPSASDRSSSCQVNPSKSPAIHGIPLYCVLIVLLVLLLPAGAAAWGGPCGEPPFNGPTYDSRGNFSQEYIKWLNDEVGPWCQRHGGTFSNGNCTPGPNWVCNLPVSSASAGNVAGALVRPRPAPPAHISTSQMMQQEFVNSATQQLVVPLLSNLFSNIFNFNSSGNNSPDPQWLEQQRLQQQEADARRRAEEEQHKQQMFDDLSRTMKLSESSNSSSNSAGGAESGGLHLKLIGGIADSPNAGNPSLPGIALNGGNTPYGIPGLPGIYTNGPASAPVMQESGLQLKLGDGSTSSSSTSANSPASESAPQVAGLQLKLGESTSGPSSTPDHSPASDSTAQGGGLQLKLGDNTAASVERSAPDVRNTGTFSGGTTLTPSPTEVTNSTLPSVGGNSAQTPALSQLQTISDSSKQAASARTLEGASASARAGFDTPGAGMGLPKAPPAVALPGRPSSGSPSSAPYQTAKVAIPGNQPSAATAGMAPDMPITPGTSILDIVQGNRQQRDAESLSQCLAQYVSPSKVQPLDELHKDLALSQAAFENLLKSHDADNELRGEWQHEMLKAAADISISATDLLTEHVLDATKEGLRADKEELHAVVVSSEEEALRLRLEIAEARAAAGADPARLAALEGQWAGLEKNQIQPLLQRSQDLREQLEKTEKWEKRFDRFSGAVEFGRWLTDTELPCNYDSKGQFTCKEFVEKNAVTQTIKGDEVTLMEDLKQTLTFAAHNKDLLADLHLAKDIGRLSLIGKAWDVSSLLVDGVYDSTVAYLGYQQLTQLNKNDAQYAKAWSALQMRIGMLERKISCYGNLPATTSRKQ